MFAATEYVSVSGGSLWSTIFTIGALIVPAVFFWIDYLIANLFYKIACQKGHQDRKYFHFCFWLGIIGYIMVAALPDRSIQNGKVSDNSNEHTS